MITFKTLDIQNFLSIAQASVDLDNQGLVLIQGVNKSNSSFDSNGSGKSSLLDSFVWALWGQTLRGYKADDVINRVVGKNCVVKLSFIDFDGASWQVIRARKSSEYSDKLLLLRNGKEWNDDVKVQEKLDSVLGIDFKLFTSSYIFCDTDVKSFAGSSDTDQKKLLGKLYDLEKYANLSDLASVNKKKHQSICQEMSLKIDNSNIVSDRLCTEIEDLEKKKEEYETSVKKKIEISVAEEMRLLNKVVVTKETLVIKEGEITSLLTSITTVEETVFMDKSVQDRIEDYQKEESQLASRIISVKKDIAEKESEIVSLADSLNAIVEVPENKSLKTRLDEYKENLSKYKGDKTKAETLLDQAQKERASLSKLAGDTCPTCKQNVSEGHMEVHILGIDSRIDDQTMILGEVANKIASYVEAIATLDKKISEISISKEATDKKRNVLITEKDRKGSVLRSVEKDLASMESKLGDIKNKRADEITLAKEISDKKKAILLLEKDRKVTEARIIEKEISRLESQAVELRKKIEEQTLETINNPYDVLIDKKSQEVLTLIEQLDKFTLDLKESERYSKGYTFLEAGFSKSGIPNMLLDSILPSLNAQVKHYSNILTGGTIDIEFTNQRALKSSKEVREAFQVIVRNKHGADSYKGASKGEARRVDLSVLFALQKTAMARNRGRFNVLWMDEIFDSLDNTGIENAINLLEEEIQTFPSIFVISHSPELATFFEKTLTVVKTNDVSTIV